jgi:hypothetical protein
MGRGIIMKSIIKLIILSLIALTSMGSKCINPVDSISREQTSQVISHKLKTIQIPQFEMSLASVQQEYRIGGSIKDYAPEVNLEFGWIEDDPNAPYLNDVPYKVKIWTFMGEDYTPLSGLPINTFSIAPNEGSEGSGLTKVWKMKFNIDWHKAETSVNFGQLNNPVFYKLLFHFVKESDQDYDKIWVRGNVKYWKYLKVMP